MRGAAFYAQRKKPTQEDRFFDAFYAFFMRLAFLRAAVFLCSKPLEAAFSTCLIAALIEAPLLSSLLATACSAFFTEERIDDLTDEF